MIKAIIFDFLGVLYVNGRLNENIAGFIRENKNGFVFALASASGDWVRERLKEDDMTDEFAVIVTADDTQLSKTDPEFYTMLAKKLDIEPKEILFIDDVASFCQAAREAGVRAIHYTPLEHSGKESDFPFLGDIHNHDH